MTILIDRGSWVLLIEAIVVLIGGLILFVTLSARHLISDGMTARVSIAIRVVLPLASIVLSVLFIVGLRPYEWLSSMTLIIAWIFTTATAAVDAPGIEKLIHHERQLTLRAAQYDVEHEVKRISKR